jgi:predicted RNase H-like HicB family nuclease
LALFGLADLACFKFGPEIASGSIARIICMSDALHLTIRYSDAEEGWVTAQIAEIPGAISEGKTRDEARSNVIDALDVLLTPDEELAGGAPVEGSEALTLKVAS